MKSKSISALMVIMVVLSASSAYADTLLPDGQYTLDISVPDNPDSPLIGGRMFIDTDMAIEPAIALNLQSKDSDAGKQSGTILGVSGGLMKYLSQGRVSPYLRAGGILILYFGDAYKANDTLLGGYAGLGAEYMITKELSLRASVNGELQLSPNFSLETSTSDLILSFFF